MHVLYIYQLILLYCSLSVVQRI